MSKITEAFQKANQQGNGALISYVTAGDPNPELTVKIVDALIEGGTDIIELGLPFSDPIADGPTIQAASLRALQAGTTPQKVLEIAKQIKAKHATPVLIMTYYNPVFRMGLEKFCSAAKEANVDGLIVPDLPVEEAAEYQQATKKYGLNTVFLAAPTTDNERLVKIVAASSGFLYLVSGFGVTGAKTSVEQFTVDLVKRVLPYTKGKVSLAVGFGISRPEHVKRIIEAGADGAIVGSAYVNIIAKNKNHKSLMLKELKETAQKLKAATKKVKE
jgi:tryptophan synthase alpha chain